MGKVMILAGTGLARRVCAAVADCDVLASLAGVTEVPCDLEVPTRIGGFGGEAGFRAALDGVSAVLDATHPFAARVTERTVRICREMGVPYLRLQQPPWPNDPTWHVHATTAAAADAIPTGARVFLSTGPGSLVPFLQRGLHLWCRRIDHAATRDGVTWIVARPPFTEDGERALFALLGVTHLVSKNAGGARAKLDAARALGLPVILADRPHLPGEVAANDVTEVMHWLHHTALRGV